MTLRKHDSEQTRRAEIVQLVEDHHAAVYRYAYRLCGSVADAEDLSQETFLRAQKEPFATQRQREREAVAAGDHAELFFGKRPPQATGRRDAS